MILSDGKNDILLSTEYGLSSFYPQTKIFHNWTKEQGLQSDHFNANSGTLRKNGNAIFGSLRRKVSAQNSDSAAPTAP